MPRGKKSQDSNSPSKSLQPRAVPASADWGGYINIRLTDEEKDDARSWIAEHQTEIFKYLTDDTWEGLKFSLSADVENQSFVATYTGAGWVGSKLRCALSARAGTWFEALGLLVYKHHVLASGDWGQYKTNGEKVDPFG